ncbi:MAG: chemotaxis protein CheW [Anaerolineae bacterium]
MESEARTEHQLVIFRLGAERFGVDIAQVQGIERLQPITRVPQAPPFIKGVINLRGQITPIMDLRQRFGFEEAEATKETRLVVVMLRGQRMALLVDAVDGVLRVSADSIEPPSAWVASVDTSCVLGIAKTEQGLIILLDLDRVLSGEEADQLAESRIARAEPASGA